MDNFDNNKNDDDNNDDDRTCIYFIHFSEKNDKFSVNNVHTFCAIFGEKMTNFLCIMCIYFVQFLVQK